MSDPSLPGTPGTGPIPEPEAEGFREEQVEAEKTRQEQERAEAEQRSKDAKDFYTGTPEEPPPDEGVTRSGSKSSSHSKESDTHTKGSSSKS